MNLAHERRFLAADRQHVLGRLGPTLRAGEAAGARLSDTASARLARELAEPVMPAAVLVPLLERSGGRLQVLFTERADHLRRHPGQISFPGGRIEHVDGSAVNAALREAEEEIGLPATAVEIAGFLAPQMTVTGFSVTAVVGLVTAGDFVATPDPGEVAAVFEVPLEYFLDERNEQRSMREYLGRSFATVEYQWQDRRIWGATAMMLERLVSIIK